MPVRRFSPSNEVGYGSLGRTQTSAGLSTKYKILDEANNIHAISLSTPQNPDSPLTFVYHILHVWKFSALQSTPDMLQVYNSQIGKKKYGTVVCKHRGYVTSEEYVNFDDQMSAVYSTAALFKGDVNLEADIPCDEPPSDSVFIPLPNAAFQACSGYGYGNGTQTLPLISAPHNILADEVQFFPNDALTAYTFGGGYRYTTTVYTSGFTSVNADIVVVNQ